MNRWRCSLRKQGQYMDIDADTPLDAAVRYVTSNTRLVLNDGERSADNTATHVVSVQLLEAWSTDDDWRYYPAVGQPPLALQIQLHAHVDVISIEPFILTSEKSSE